MIRKLSESTENALADAPDNWSRVVHQALQKLAANQNPARSIAKSSTLEPESNPSVTIVRQTSTQVAQAVVQQTTQVAQAVVQQTTQVAQAVVPTSGQMTEGRGTLPPAASKLARQHELLSNLLGYLATVPSLPDVLTRVLQCVFELSTAQQAILAVNSDTDPESRTWAKILSFGGLSTQASPLVKQLNAPNIEAVMFSVAKQLQGRAHYETHQADQRLLALPIVEGGTQRGVLLLILPIEAVAPPMDALQIAVAHAGLALGYAASTERERRRTARFQLIARVAKLINRSGDLMSTLQMAADAIHEVLEYPNVDIPLVDPARPNTLEIRIRGGGYKQINHSDRIRFDQGIIGAAAQTRRTILVNDVNADPRHVRPPVAKHSRAELAVPILSGDHVLGVLNVEGDDPFNELDQLTIEAIAQHLAMAIDNAALIEEQQNHAIGEERQRLAYELHDSVTQALSGISLLAQALPSAWKKGSDEGLRASARVAELAQLAVAEMRTLLRELSPKPNSSQNTSRRRMLPAGLDLIQAAGLAEALPKLISVLVPPQISVVTDFAAYTMQRLEHENAFYRVFQEAISNLVRHSGASELRLAGRVEGGQVVISLRDNGCGLSAKKTAGYGFSSMRSRMERLGGALLLRSLHPRGFEVLASLQRSDRAAK